MSQCADVMAKIGGVEYGASNLGVTADVIARLAKHKVAVNAYSGYYDSGT